MEIPVEIHQQNSRKMEVILVTDDLYSNRLVLREMLKRIHVQTIEAINGAEAVLQVKKSFARNSPYIIRLVLMDLNMPVMDGIQALNEIKKIRKDQQVILCSAYGEFKQDISSWISDAYVVKSADMTELKSVIKDLLKAP